MSIQNIDFGSGAENDGEFIATAFQKVQANFEEVFADTAARRRQCLHVKDYGAVGNGVADDTAALIAARAAVEEQGNGIVSLSDGRYRTTGKIWGNNVEPLLVYSDKPSVLGLFEGNADNPDTVTNDPVLYVSKVTKYDNTAEFGSGAYFAQNVGAVFGETVVKGTGSAGSVDTDGTWNSGLFNCVIEGVNRGTESAPDFDAKGSAIGVAAFARNDGYPGKGAITTALWGYPSTPALTDTEFAHLPVGEAFATVGLEINIDARHKDTGNKTSLGSHGDTAGIFFYNYRPGGLYASTHHWTTGINFGGWPLDGNFASTDPDNWSGFWNGALINFIRGAGIRFGGNFSNDAYGVVFPNSWANARLRPAAGIALGDTQLNLGQYTGATFNNNDFWHNAGGLFFRYSGVNERLITNRSGTVSLPYGTALNWSSGDAVITHTTTDLLTVSGANVAFTNPISPTTNDAASLGFPTVSWSDLFMASGAVVNFANGNATLTHSTGLLTSSVPVAVPDDAYNATSWNGSVNVPTKNAVRDQIEAEPAAIRTLTNKTINANNNTISNLATSMFATNVVDTDGTLGANSDTRLASQKAVKTYVDQSFAANDAMVYKGQIDCSANPNYPAADAGHTYRVSVAGKIGGASGTNVEIGDLLICKTDASGSGNQATVGGNWTITQANLDGAVIGPSSATDSHFAQFDGTSGKLIKGGKAAPAGVVVGTTDAQTLTNKTLTSPAISSPTGLVKGDVGLGNVDNTSDATKNSATATLTNKTINLSSNTLTGTTAQFNTALSDGDFATLAGAETLTNKTLTNPVVGTQSARDNSTKAASTAYVDNATREKLSANRTYYVRSDGNDSNNGLVNNAGGAFLTVAKAISVAAALDGSTYDVTIQVGAGTWTADVVLPNFIGSGVWTLKGDSTTPANVTISTSGVPIRASNLNSKWVVDGFKLVTSGFAALQVYNSTIDYKNVEFGAAGTAQVYVSATAVANQTGACRVSGGSVAHAFVEFGGMWNPFGQGITFTTTVTFSGAFVFGFANAVVRAAGMTFTNPGNVTGVRYDLSLNAVAVTNGGGASYFPGTSSGTTATGAQYS